MRSVDLIMIELSDVLEISVGQEMVRRRISSTTDEALFHELLTADNKSLMCVCDCGIARMRSLIFSRKNSFSGVKGCGFNWRL